MLLGFGAVLLALVLFGEAFRAHVFLFLAIWLLLPLLSIFILLAGIFDVKALRMMRLGFMIYVVAVSAYVSTWGAVRDYIGTNYIEGYHSWVGDRAYDEGYEQYYYKDEWRTATPGGQRILEALWVSTVIAAFGCPALTWKCFQAAIRRMEQQQCQETDTAGRNDGDECGRNANERAQ